MGTLLQNSPQFEQIVAVRNEKSNSNDQSVSPCHELSHIALEFFEGVFPFGCFDDLFDRGKEIGRSDKLKHLLVCVFS